MKKPYDDAAIGDEIIEGDSPLDWLKWWRQTGHTDNDLRSSEETQRMVSYRLRRKVSTEEAGMYLANEWARAIHTSALNEVADRKAEALRSHTDALGRAGKLVSNHTIPEGGKPCAHIDYSKRFML